MNTVIVGVGASLPKNCVSNDELSLTLDTSDEWISSRTGIKQRHIASEGETTSTLATEAARRALEQANVDPEEVDLIIVGTVTGDYTFPSTATLVQRNLNAGGVAFDVSAACSGFVYALSIADSFIKLNKAKCALVIGAETFSRVVDWQDRSTCVLFGDGAGAVVLKATDRDDLGVRYCKICSDGRYAEDLITNGGVSTNQKSGVLQMNGRGVFKFAVEKFYSSMMELLDATNLTMDDIDLIVPHQANYRIMKKLAEMLNVGEDKLLIAIDKHANTSAASIPLALGEIRDSLFSYKNIVLLSMGAGFTWGAALITLK